ncbi:MAG: VapE domain-containing protein [Chloroflexota bacterium]
MSFVRSLLNAGIDGHDAQVLEAHYANEPEFVEGLETIARAMALNQGVSLIPPSGEPWRTIHAQMLQGGDLQQEFFTVIAALAPELQTAISGAVSTRMSQLQQYAQQHQIPQGKKRKTQDYINTLNYLGYRFRYNLCTSNVEVNGKPISDPLAAAIRGKLRDNNIENITAAEDAYLANAWQNRYHPMRDYFASLTYQGNDAIGELAGYIQDAQNMFPVFLRRWLVGSVARVMSRAQNRMLVLDGRQGLGKDYLAGWLCSPMPEYFHEGAINPEDKDCRLRLMYTWIWTVSEVGATTRKNDREALKAFLTMETVRDRKPFGKFDIQGPAITSFIGTINNEGGFLSDPTGNRRFMVCKLLGIDWGYTQIDVDQVWAQAYDLYLTGEPWNLQASEAQAANEINESYQVDDLIEASILKYFRIDPNQRNWWLSTVDIAEHLESKGVKFGSPLSTGHAIGKAMTSIGLERKKDFNAKRQRVNGYVGICVI